MWFLWQGMSPCDSDVLLYNVMFVCSEIWSKPPNNTTLRLTMCLIAISTLRRFWPWGVGVISLLPFPKGCKRVVSTWRHFSIKPTISSKEARLGQTKTFRKGSEASLRAEGGRGYVIIFSNEPSCCYVATSERRRIRLKADYHLIALRGASIRRSRWDNTLPVKNDYSNKLFNSGCQSSKLFLAW